MGRARNLPILPRGRGREGNRSSKEAKDEERRGKIKSFGDFDKVDAVELLIPAAHTLLLLLLLREREREKRESYQLNKKWGIIGFEMMMKMMMVRREEEEVELLCRTVNE